MSPTQTASLAEDHTDPPADAPEAGVDDAQRRAIEDEAFALFEQGRHAESNAILLPVVPALYDTAYLNFLRGRNHFYLGELNEAAHFLGAAAGGPDPFPWAFYEMARLKAAADDLPGAAGFASRFLERMVSHGTAGSLYAGHWADLIDIAHRCFAVNRHSAMELYRWLAAQDTDDYLVHLRAAEDLIDKKHGAAAEAALLKLEARFPLDIWGFYARGKALALQGDHDGAAAAILKTLAPGGNDPFLIAQAVHLLLEVRCHAKAREVLHHHAPWSPGALFHPRLISGHFRAAALQRDYTRIDELYAHIPHLNEKLERWIIVEALFETTLLPDQMAPADIRFTAQLAKFLEQHIADADLSACLALYHYYTRRRMWARADEFSLALTHFPLAGHPEILLRQFELLCLRQKFAEAETFFQTFMAGRPLGQAELAAVMRYYVDAQRWPDARRVLLEFMSRGFLLPKGEHLILQICRQCAAHEEVLAALIAAGLVDHEGAKLLRQFIVDDLCVQQGTREVRICAAGQDHLLRVEPGNDVLLPLPPAGAETDVVYFTCADRPYFFSVLTLLASFGLHAPGAPWFVFVDQAVPEAWTAATQAFSQILGLKIHFVREAEFVASDLVLHDTYGIFTGGNTLSRAAFFRIYAARYLAARNKTGRCIYLDSDIILVTEPTGFETLEFAGACLLARTEEFSPEIRDASQKNALDPETYFNSGVLQFDFGDPALADLLSEAIRLSEFDHQRLVFHDQCALNIAFQNRTGPLAPRFNYFLRPGRPDNGDVSNAVLAHFLDKPKPWDVTYNRSYRTMWLPHAEAVCANLDGAVYADIVAASAGRA